MDIDKDNRLVEMETLAGGFRRNPSHRNLEEARVMNVIIAKVVT